MSKIIKNFKELKEDVISGKRNNYTFVDSTISFPTHKSWICIFYIVDRTPQPESILHVMAKFSNISKDTMELKTPRQIVIRIADFPLFKED